jgi:hypothetical protein
MSLPRLYAVPKDDAELQSWAWNHQANHFDIVAAGQRYQEVTFTVATNATTLAGNSVLQFASLPAGVKEGMIIADQTSPTAIDPAAQVTGFSGTLVEIGIPAVHNIGSGDVILFAPGANVQALTQFQLSPINSDDFGGWLYQHQTMHSQINQVLGLTGFNLIDLDLEDDKQFAEWLNQNADEHARICSVLGIG